MNSIEQKRIKTHLVKVCKVQGTYKKEVEDFQIDNLVYNLTLIHNAKADIFEKRPNGQPSKR
jgi:hypothetical protein